MNISTLSDSPKFDGISLTVGPKVIRHIEMTMPPHPSTSHLFLQQLTVDEPRFAVCEAASRAGVHVARGQGGHHVFILPGLNGDILEQN